MSNVSHILWERWGQLVFLDQLRDADLSWEQFSRYHFRIEGLVDFWMPYGRWYVQPDVGPEHPFKRQRGEGALSCIGMVLKIRKFLDGENPDQGRP